MTNILKNALKTIKKAYKGLDDSGVHTLDKSLVGDDLKFDLAMTQVSLAIKNGEITEEKFIDHISYIPGQSLGEMFANELAPIVIPNPASPIPAIAIAITIIVICVMVLLAHLRHLGVL